jgi:Secretion system C-terminal sorting domain
MKKLTPLPQLWCAFAGAVAFVCSLTSPAFGQSNGSETRTKPRVSMSVVQENTLSKNGVSTQDSSFAGTLLLRERSLSIFRRDSAFQTGSVAIRRIGGDLEQLLVVAYMAEYLDSNGVLLPDNSPTVISLPQALPMGVVVSPPFPASTPVGINGFQGDLSPTTSDPNGVRVPFGLGSRTLPNTANILQGQSQVLLRFTARWSDQSLMPRTAGLQGRRFVRLRLLEAFGNVYELGATLATVVLDDPLRVGPVILNAIQDKNLQRTATDLIELESPNFRSDGLPGTVFYDENYNLMTYSAFSSDSTLAAVAVRQNDARFGNRPSLFYAVQPGAPLNSVVTITVIANDGTGLIARDEFNVTIVQTVTSSVKSEASAAFTVAPNPSTDRVVISATAQTSGRLRMKISTLLGETVQILEQSVSAGSEYRQEIDISDLATGVYLVEVQDGASRSVRKMVKK